MTDAYSEYYIVNLSRSLGVLFEIGIDSMSMDPDYFAHVFSDSPVAKGIESGDPRYVMGMTGTEMADRVLGEQVSEYRLVRAESEARWSGHIAAYTQVSLGYSFSDIFDSFPCSRLMSSYGTLHEAPESKTVNIIAEALAGECPIRVRRKELGMTQKEVADYSGISLPTIRAYEQGVLDLGNASGYSLMRISEVLDLSIEDLLKGSKKRAR